MPIRHFVAQSPYMKRLRFGVRGLYMDLDPMRHDRQALITCESGQCIPDRGEAKAFPYNTPEGLKAPAIVNRPKPPGP
jgi:hypothetical protein